MKVKSENEVAPADMDFFFFQNENSLPFVFLITFGGYALIRILTISTKCQWKMKIDDILLAGDYHHKYF